MQDNFGRNIDYLRISVTDKCNLRCKYCMPPQGVELIAHEELLTLEELARVVRICGKLGVRGVRFTGGEPLVRKNLEKLIREVHENPEIQEIAITTNGVLLAEQLDRLSQSGVTAVNISLDTTDPVVFQRITGVDACGKVLQAIRASADAGLRTKVNCVPCREWNEAGLDAVAELAKDLPVDVRFIELMPVGCGREYHGIPTGEVLARLEERFGPAQSIRERRGNGPADYYEFEGFRGKIGFISPMSHKFCKECNRIRLTAEGRLKLCLHYDIGIELKPLIRGGYSDEEISQAIQQAVRNKPRAHAFEKQENEDNIEQRKMVQIGG